MRGCVIVAFALLLAAPAAHAQAMRDGVEAFARGEYSRAAEILKPLVESWPPGDHTATFFMAVAYENGLGVPVDPLRACALYIRALGDGAGTFTQTADELLATMQDSMAPGDLERCLLLARVGFEHGFQPVTFVLEPQHWIRIDLDAATIHYLEREKRFELAVARPGAVFLTIEHTELRFGPTQVVRRHFVEFFSWIPGGDDRTWTLIWYVFEVVRDELVNVTNVELATVSGERPPAAFDVRALAMLRVNENGYAEWTVSSGAEAQTQRIPMESERREIAEQARARKEGEAKVDWSRVRDITRAPSLAYADGDGCGHVFVYGWSEDRTEAITIHADRELLAPSEPRTFELASRPPGIEVLVHVYDRPVRSWPFCSCVVDPSLAKETWTAVAGSITVEPEPRVVGANRASDYRATVRVRGLEIVSSRGIRVKQVQPLALTAIVGWVSG